MIKLQKGLNKTGRQIIKIGPGSIPSNLHLLFIIHLEYPPILPILPVILPVLPPARACSYRDIMPSKTDNTEQISR